MKMTKKQRRTLGKILAAACLTVIGVLAGALGDGLVFDSILYIALAAAYLLVGLEVLIRAVRGVIGGQLLDENFLMAIATVGAILLGEVHEGVAVMLFYQIGELFQSLAVASSRRSITSLMDMRADFAEVERGGTLQRVDPEEVAVGEIIVVKPGEKLPLDGEIVEGTTTLNTAALTGESLPQSVTVGDAVMNGCVNGEGVIRVRTTKPYGESTVAKILDLVENAASKKSRRERFITRFARVYTPVVVIAAALLAVIGSLITGDFRKWIAQGLTFLVISCPCALVISVPLSFFGGIGAASKRGILVKGGSALEALTEIETVVFDKTGTLTEGSFALTEIHPDGISERELLHLAAIAESASSHPIARSIAAAYRERYGEPDVSRVRDIVEHAAAGVRCRIDGHRVAVGGARMLGDAAPVEAGRIWVIVDDAPVGYLKISDKIKPTAKSAIASLRSAGIRRTVMLTGDNAAAAHETASALGIDEHHAELLPADKVTKLESLIAVSKTAFIGDGINDAPVISRADVGIAMGGIGSDAAIEAADIVLMDDDPQKVAAAIRIARKTVRIALENTIFALLIKSLIMLLGILGRANMWLAVFADVGVSILAILNSMRTLW